MNAVKSFIKAVLKRIAAAVAQQPWLLNAAKAAVARFPNAKMRLKRMIGAAPPEDCDEQTISLAAQDILHEIKRLKQNRMPQ